MLFTLPFPAFAQYPGSSPRIQAEIEMRGYWDDHRGIGHRMGLTTLSAAVDLEYLSLILEWDAGYDAPTGLGGNYENAFGSNPYIGLRHSIHLCIPVELEFGATLPLASSTGDASLLGLETASHLLGGQAPWRFRSNEAALLLTVRVAPSGSYKYYIDPELALGLSMAANDRGEGGVPVLAGVNAGWWLDRGNVALGARTNLSAIIGVTDPQWSLEPFFRLRTGDIGLRLYATLNLLGESDSTFTGGPWAVGLALELPAAPSHRGRMGQCFEDWQCPGGYTCQIFSDCEMCDGGPAYCAPGF